MPHTLHNRFSAFLHNMVNLGKRGRTQNRLTREENVLTRAGAGAFRLIREGKQAKLLVSEKFHYAYTIKINTHREPI